METTSIYTPPKVWQWNTESGGTWAKTNRPTAGATHEQDLPQGQHALQLYSLATPNGQKVTIALEEFLELGITAAERPAVQRGRRVNRIWGPGEEQLHERHSAHDFGT